MQDSQNGFPLVLHLNLVNFYGISLEKTTFLEIFFCNFAIFCKILANNRYLARFLPVSYKKCIPRRNMLLARILQRFHFLARFSQELYFWMNLEIFQKEMQLHSNYFYPFSSVTDGRLQILGRNV